MTKQEDINKKRIEEISCVFKSIFDKGENVLKEKCISTLMYQYGCSRRKILEYIQAASSLIDFVEKGELYVNKIQLAPKVQN